MAASLRWGLRCRSSQQSLQQGWHKAGRNVQALARQMVPPRAAVPFAVRTSCPQLTTTSPEPTQEGAQGQHRHQGRQVEQHGGGDDARVGCQAMGRHAQQLGGQLDLLAPQREDPSGEQRQAAKHEACGALAVEQEHGGHHGGDLRQQEAGAWEW